MYGFYHFIVETLGRVKVAMPYLRANPTAVLLVGPPRNGDVKKGINSIKFMQPYLAALGLEAHRVVTFTEPVLLREAFIPIAAGCGAVHPDLIRFVLLLLFLLFLLLLLFLLFLLLLLFLLSWV